MPPGRRWEGAGDDKDADALLVRFVKHVVRERSGRPRPRRSPSDTTAVVTPPLRPVRQREDETAPVRVKSEELELDRLRIRRLLGQDDPKATLVDEQRRQFIVELAALHRHGHIDSVIEEVELARSRHPTDVALHAALAEFFLEQGDLPRAVELMFALVALHFERRDPDAVRRTLERVRTIDPENPRLRRLEKMLDRPASS